MDKKVISCEFNIDTACVEVRFVDSSMIAIDCTLVEAEAARNKYERSILRVVFCPNSISDLHSKGVVFRRC